MKIQTCWISLRNTVLRCFRFESAFAMLLLPSFENARVSITIKRCEKPLVSSNNRSTLAGSSPWAPCKHFPKWGMPCWAFRCLPTFLQGGYLSQYRMVWQRFRRPTGTQEVKSPIVRLTDMTVFAIHEPFMRQQISLGAKKVSGSGDRKCKVHDMLTWSGGGMEESQG